MSNDELQDRVLQLISIYKTQVLLASRKKHKLRIYEEFVKELEKVAVL